MPAHGQQLGNDCPCNLGGALRPDIETGRPVEFRQVGGANLGSALCEVCQEAFESGPGTERPDIGHVGPHERVQVVEVTEVVVGHQHHICPLIGLDDSVEIARLGVDQMSGIRETILGEELPAIIDNRDFESDLGSEADKRSGIVTGSAHDQSRRRTDDLQEQAVPTGLMDPMPAFPERIARYFGHAVRKRAFDAGGRHKRPRTGRGREIVNDDRRALLSSNVGYHGGEPDRSFAGLDEQLRGTVAPDTPTPDRLVVRREVEFDHLRNTRLHDAVGDDV